MKKKIIIVAIVIVLLMVSSATAVNVRQLNKTDEILKTSEVDNVYINPDLYLTKEKYLLVLKDALPAIEDPDIQLLVQEIINELETNDIDNIDMENIVNTLDIPKIGIFLNKDITCKAWSGYFLSGIYSLSWKAGTGPEITVSWTRVGILFLFQGEHSGFLVWTPFTPHKINPYANAYHFWGHGSFIIIKGEFHFPETGAENKPSAHPVFSGILSRLLENHPNLFPLLQQLFKNLNPPAFKQ